MIARCRSKTPPLTHDFSLNVRLHAEPPQIGQQKLDEEVCLLGVGYPQYAAAVACDGVIPTGREPVSNMQRLPARQNSVACRRGFSFFTGNLYALHKIIALHRINSIN